MGKKIRSMFVSLLILLVCAGALFFIGWTQFRVAADSVGVVSSKTGGIAGSVVRPGAFSWHWEFLIPTNASLQTFRIHPYSFYPKAYGSLPSAGDYSAALKSHPDFSYQFDFEIRLAVSPESLPQLVQKSAVADQQSLESYLSAAADALAKAAAADILGGAGNSTADLPTNWTTERLAAAAGAGRLFPELEIIHFSVVSARFPDWELYQTARRRYLAEVGSRQDFVPLESSPSSAGPEKLREPETGGSDRHERKMELLRLLEAFIEEEKA